MGMGSNRGQGRVTMSEINVTPMVDVMLVLLMGVSVSSWALIVMKHTQLSKARAQSLTFLDTFW